MKRFFLTAMAVFAVSAMFISCNKENGGNSEEEEGVSYELLFNYGVKSSTGSETPVLNTILEKAKELTTAADIALYGGTGSAPFAKTLSAKTEDAAKAEYNKLIESAKAKGNEIIAELNKIVSENSDEIDGYPTTKYVELEFSYMLMKTSPDMFGGIIVVETDCRTFKVAGKFMPGRIISVL